jgi:hypothetical protein
MSCRRLVLFCVLVAMLAAVPAASGAGSLALSASFRPDGRTVVLRWPSQAPAHVTLTRDPGNHLIVRRGSRASSAVDHVRDAGGLYSWTLRVQETGAVAAITLSTRPAPPLGLAVFQGAGARLQLRWAPRLDPDVNRVVVRRTASATSRPDCPAGVRGGRAVGRSGRRNAQPDPAARPGRHLCYAVFAIDRHGNVSDAARVRALRPTDVAGLRASGGCTSAALRWSTASLPRSARVRVVRNGRHVPRGPRDGRPVRHGKGRAVDGAVHQFRTYHYRVFTAVPSGNPRQPFFYSTGVARTIRTGRICKPRDGAVVRRLTPLIRWSRYRGAYRYAVLIRRARRTVLVGFAARNAYRVPSSWIAGGRPRHLHSGHTYVIYVYAYTARHPEGRAIGSSHFTVRL